MSEKSGNEKKKIKKKSKRNLKKKNNVEKVIVLNEQSTLRMHFDKCNHVG